jgi:endoglucanase
MNTKHNLGRGINLGGWLSQAPDTDAHRVNFICEDDLKRIADWGFDNIRLPFDYPMMCTASGIDTLRESGLEWIDKGIEWAENAGLKVILDMHQLPGYTFMDPVNNPDSTPPLFTDPEQREFFFDLWRALSRRYLGRFPNMVFELANEIAAPTAGQWNELAAAAVVAIREIDSNRTIMVGSNCWNVCSTYVDLAVIDDPNIIYNFHFYNPFTFTHQLAPWSPEVMYYGKNVNYPGNSPGLRDAANRATAENNEHIAGMLNNLAEFFEDRVSDKQHLVELMSASFNFAAKNNVSLYCGEFGVYDAAPTADALRWLKDTLEVFAENNVSWSIWSYKGLGFGIVDNDGKVRNPEQLNILRGIG